MDRGAGDRRRADRRAAQGDIQEGERAFGGVQVRQGQGGRRRDREVPRKLRRGALRRRGEHPAPLLLPGLQAAQGDARGVHSRRAGAEEDARRAGRDAHGRAQDEPARRGLACEAHQEGGQGPGRACQAAAALMFIRRLKDCVKPEDPARIVFLVTAWFAAYYFVLCRFAFNSVHHQATPAMLVSGTAYKPFQYRALVGWVVGLFSSAFPGIPLPTWFRLAELFSVFFLLVAYRSYIALFIKDEILASLLSFFMLYVLFFNYLLYPNYPVWFPWDMPSVLFFTLGLTLIYRRRWALYYPLFILATFNRETSCFLTVVYLLTAIKKDPAGTVALHFSAQLLIWVAVKSFLFLLYAGNPGWELFE